MFRKSAACRNEVDHEISMSDALFTGHRCCTLPVARPCNLVVLSAGHVTGASVPHVRRRLSEHKSPIAGPCTKAEVTTGQRLTMVRTADWDSQRHRRLLMLLLLLLLLLSLVQVPGEERRWGGS